MKKNKNKIITTICVILTLIIAGSLIVGAADGVILLGDIDNDGKITVTDARSVLRMAIDLDPKQTMSVSGTKSDVELTSPLSIVKANKGEDGDYFVCFKNMGNDIISASIKAVFYDKNGKKVHEDIEYTDTNPGGIDVCEFHCWDDNYDPIDFSSVKFQYDSYDIHQNFIDVSSNVQVTFAKNLLNVNDEYVSFSVKNNGKNTVDLLDILIIGYDNNGNICSVDYAYPDFSGEDVINPSATIGGEKLCYFPDNMVRYEVVVNANSYIGD